MTKKFVHTRFHLPYGCQLVERAKELRQNMTVAEKKLWNGYLRTFPLRVMRQRPIAHFIVDFYCAELKLVIEVDGDSHFTEDARSYDRERTQILNGYGLTVMRFTSQQILDEFEGVCLTIAGVIPLNPPYTLKRFAKCRCDPSFASYAAIILSRKSIDRGAGMSS